MIFATFRRIIFSCDPLNIFIDSVWWWRRKYLRLSLNILISSLMYRRCKYLRQSSIKNSTLPFNWCLINFVFDSQIGVIVFSRISWLRSLWIHRLRCYINLAWQHFIWYLDIGVVGFLVMETIFGWLTAKHAWAKTT